MHVTYVLLQLIFSIIGRSKTEKPLYDKKDATISNQKSIN